MCGQPFLINNRSIIFDKEYRRSWPICTLLFIPALKSSTISSFVYAPDDNTILDWLQFFCFDIHLTFVRRLPLILFTAFVGRLHERFVALNSSLRCSWCSSKQMMSFIYLCVLNHILCSQRSIFEWKCFEIVG